MYPLVGLATIVLLAYIVIKIGATALELTGLSPDIARFQALSAFTNCGFTTEEAENVMKHGARRRIIKTLILIGYVGITTTVATLLLTFLDHKESWSIKMPILTGIFALILVLINSKFVNSKLQEFITKILSQNKELMLADYNQILGVEHGYVLSKIHIDDDSWMVGKKVKDLRLDYEGTLILAIERKFDNNQLFQGAPNGKTVLACGDMITCYGREDALKCLAARTEFDGELMHEKQVELEKVAK